MLEHKLPATEPFPEEIFYICSLPQQQLPATNKFLKHALIFEKELDQSKSYQLPSNFKSICVFVSFARTAATSYHQDFEEHMNFKNCAGTKATSYHSVFKGQMNYKICTGIKATSYHPDFEEHMNFRIFAGTTATSYHPVFEGYMNLKICART